jgi:hypothetical protein
MDEHEKRVDLSDESGITRRDMLRRGAIVGGTLLWVAPAIQSMAPKALAAVQGPSPGSCSVCYCYSGPISNPTKDVCTQDGAGGLTPPTGFFGLFSSDECENWCKWQNDPPLIVGSNAAPNGPYTNSQYCSGTSCQCNTNAQPGVNGATCS